MFKSSIFRILQCNISSMKKFLKNGMLKTNNKRLQFGLRNLIFATIYRVKRQRGILNFKEHRKSDQRRGELSK